MVERSNSEHSTGLYGRLLERLSLALDEARTAEQMGKQEPLELELRGVSAAELELIRAYRENDLQWLRGWQAAAEEFAFLNRQPAPGPGQEPTRMTRTHAALFSCALCGEALGESLSRAEPVCRRCGSRLFCSGTAR